MFSFDPKDAKENDFPVLQPGIYEAEVLSVEDKVSKAGNQMLVLSLCVFGNAGEKVRVFDYIVNPSTLWKLKSICRCLSWEFMGTLDEQLLVGKRFKVKLKLKPEGEFPAKNEIVHYEEGIGVPKTDAEPANSTAPTADEIPF